MKERIYITIDDYKKPVNNKYYIIIIFLYIL